MHSIFTGCLTIIDGFLRNSNFVNTDTLVFVNTAYLRILVPTTLFFVIIFFATTVSKITHTSNHINSSSLLEFFLIKILSWIEVKKGKYFHKSTELLE